MFWECFKTSGNHWILLQYRHWDKCLVKETQGCCHHQMWVQREYLNIIQININFQLLKVIKRRRMVPCMWVMSRYCWYTQSLEREEISYSGLRDPIIGKADACFTIYTLFFHFIVLSNFTPGQDVFFYVF